MGKLKPSQAASAEPERVTHMHVVEPLRRPPLTLRQAEILRHVAAGLQNKEIAQRMGLSLCTVRNHVHHILEQLGVHSKLEAVSLAFRNGWIVPETLPSRETWWRGPGR